MSSKYNIGDEWECPRCHDKIVIGEDGLEHGCNKHYINYRPEDLKAIREYSDRQEKIWLYGETKTDQHK